jgi:hypothetical protein
MWFNKLVKESKGKRLCMWPGRMSPSDFMRIPELLNVAAEVALLLPVEGAETFRRAFQQLALEDPRWSKVLLIAPGDPNYAGHFELTVAVD